MFHFSFFHRIEKRNSALNFLKFNIYFFSISTPTTNKQDDVIPVKHFSGLPVILLELQTNLMTVYWLCIFRHWLGIWLCMTSTEAFSAKQHVPIVFLKMKMSTS